MMQRITFASFGVVYVLRRVIGGRVIQASYAFPEWEREHARDLVAMRLREFRAEFRRACAEAREGLR